MSRRSLGVILKPYRKTDSLRRRLLTLSVYPLMGLFCLLYGLFFGAIAPLGLLIFAVPLVILGGFVIWALPDSRASPMPVVIWCFWAYTAALVIWPNYMAIALPGLPWITMDRVFGAPLVLCLLISISVSSEVRKKLSAAMANARPMGFLLAAFIVIQFFSIFTSSVKYVSAEKFFDQQISWTAIFVASIFFFSREGRAKHFFMLLWGLGLFVGLIGLAEFRAGRVLWAGHIPSFLAVSDPSVLLLLSGQHRAGDGLYRAQSVFTTSLVFAEYMVLVVPFLLHFMMGRFDLRVRIAAFVSLGIWLAAIIATNARLGLVGFILSCLLYGAFWVFLRWKNNRDSIIGPALTLSAPVLFVAALLAVWAVPALHVRVLGGAAQQASTDSRKEQYAVGLPKIASHPWGYGNGQAAETLGFVQPDGLLTIDSGYLSVALDFGVAGFLLFYGMTALMIWKSARFGLSKSEQSVDYSFLVPAAVALMVFFVIRSIMSLSGNQALFFMLYGMIVAMTYRIANEKREALPVAA